MGQWSGPQHGPYLEQSQSMLNAGGNSAGLGPHPAVTHDADILQAAQLLLPGSFRDTQPPPQPLPYLPEELNHFQEFTHFLDSIGLPSEWVPALREVPQVQGTVPADVPDPVRNPREPQQGTSRRSQAERSRADSPFRSWLPSVPSEDQSLGTVSDYGAQYRFEHRNAERLFYASKAIVLHKLSKETHAPLATYNGIIQIPLDSIRELSQAGQATALSPSENDLGMIAWRQIETIRTLLTLMGYATWEKSELVQEAFSLQGLLVRCLREFGLTENITVAPRHSPMQWHEWAEEESIRRTRFISFCFVHVHSIAYNIYPVLRSSEVHLRLPCSTKEWKATTAQEWELAQKEVGAQQLFFQDALALLLQPSRTTVLLDPIPAPLGNYILLHGLLQRIHLVSELSLPTGDQALALPTEELNKLE
ncbi:hypothetical protein APSETT444_005052 [Aspergillus pseudonomiae]